MPLCSPGSLHKPFPLSGVLSSLSSPAWRRFSLDILAYTSPGITDMTRATARSIWFHSSWGNGGGPLNCTPWFTGYLCQVFTQEHKQGPVATWPLAFSESSCQVPGLKSCWARGPLPCSPRRTAKVARASLWGQTGSFRARREGGSFYTHSALCNGCCWKAQPAVNYFFWSTYTVLSTQGLCGF